MKMDLKEMEQKFVEWFNLAKYMARWWVVSQNVNEPLGSIKCRKLLD